MEALKNYISLLCYWKNKRLWAMLLSMELQKTASTSKPPHISDYQLICMIGEGAFGRIWLGRDALGLYRAVKVISYEDFDSLESYQAEYYGIRHYAPYSRKYEGLMEIHHVGIHKKDGYYYYVMDLADDLRETESITTDYKTKTLRAYLDAQPGHRVSTHEALRIGIEVAESLSYLHSVDLVHRDIKPENILCINGKWKLADLGFVSRCGGKTYVGSLGYIAPEGPGHPSADVHGVGKILYEMVTGNEVVDFPECPSWIFDDESEASHFQEFNAIILKAADPIAAQRQQCGWSLLGELESILPEGQQESSVTVSPVACDWGRYVYAALAFGLVMAVFNYVRLVDQALEEATIAPVQEIAGSK